jgi:hypothetical protein
MHTLHFVKYVCNCLMHFLRPLGHGGLHADDLVAFFYSYAVVGFARPRPESAIAWSLINVP